MNEFNHGVTIRKKIESLDSAKNELDEMAIKFDAIKKIPDNEYFEFNNYFFIRDDMEVACWVKSTKNLHVLDRPEHMDILLRDILVTVK